MIYFTGLNNELRQLNIMESSITFGYILFFFLILLMIFHNPNQLFHPNPNPTSNRKSPNNNHNNNDGDNGPDLSAS